VPDNDIEHEIGPDLIGKTISFLDGKTDTVMDCTIQDYGWSKLQDEWVEVTYNGTTEMRISPEEMGEILANRVHSSETETRLCQDFGRMVKL